MTQRNMTNILGGPCAVRIGDVDAGHTVGETRLSVTPILRERREDATGQTVTDLIHLGDTVRLTMRVAEWTLETLSLIYPLGADGPSGLGIGSEPGRHLAALAETMVLHPLELDDADTSHDVIFWKAVAVGSVSVGYASDADRVFDVEFLMLPDATRSDGERIGRIGA